MSINLFLIIVDFRVRLSCRRLTFPHLRRRRRRLAGARLAHAGWRGAIGAMLLRLLTPRFDVGQRRPDKFAIHNYFLQMKKRIITNPEFNSAGSQK